MKCPIDSADLLVSDRRRIEIDYCPTCRGVWLDCGELDKIVERNAVENERWCRHHGIGTHRARLHRPVQAGATFGRPRSEPEVPMKCPIDSAELVMSDHQGIEIDYCPTCRGVWLDRGELDKIIERNAAETERGRDDDRRGGVSGRKPQKRTREGFLGELFELRG